MAKSELQMFDGLDNRKELMLLLVRLGSDRRRRAFIESLIPEKYRGHPGFPMKVTGPCDPVAAYYMLIGICNELQASINDAARKLEQEVKRHS